MQFTDVITYPTDVATLIDANRTPTYHRFRLEKSGATVTTSNVTPCDNGFRVTAEFSLAADTLPSQAQRFLNGDLHATMVEEWQASAESHVFQVATHLTIDHMSANVTASSTISGDADATQRTIDGTLSVNIPFFGGVIENAAAPYITQIFSADVDALVTWLAR